MELALTLVIITIFDLVCTVWLLAKHADMKRRLSGVEARNSCGAVDAGAAPVQGLENKDIYSAIASATPEDIAEARRVIEALGLDKE